MADPQKPRGEGPQGADRVVRTPRDQRKRLDPELEALARGDADRPERPRPPPRLRDDRTIRQIPGVSNRDGRAIYDARVAALMEAAAGGLEGRERLAVLLAEAVALRVWRGRAVVGFEAFTEQVVSLPAEEAGALAEEGRARAGLATEDLSDEAVAAWMRAEAALLEEGHEGRVWVSATAGVERLHLDLPARGAPPALALVGKRLAPLAADFEGGRDARRGRDNRGGPEGRDSRGGYEGRGRSEGRDPRGGYQGRGRPEGQDSRGGYQGRGRSESRDNRGRPEGRDSRGGHEGRGRGGGRGGPRS